MVLREGVACIESPYSCIGMPSMSFERSATDDDLRVGVAWIVECKGFLKLSARGLMIDCGILGALDGGLNASISSAILGKVARLELPIISF